MKKTCCRDLHGACDVEILGETPEEMGENCKRHVMEMMQAGDKEHISAVESMRLLNKEEQEKWHAEFKRSFDSLPEA